MLNSRKSSLAHKVKPWTVSVVHDGWDRMKTQLLWFIHNMFANPMSEVLYWMGLSRVGNWLHDITVPEHKQGEGRGSRDAKRV